MAGKIKELIDYIISQRAANNPTGEKVIKAKLILKGINPNKYTADSPDDQAVLDKLQTMLTELKIDAAPAATTSGSMCTRTAWTQKTSIDEALADLEAQLAGVDPRLILFFASTCHNPDSLSERMQDNFPNALVVGCSTAGEIVSGQMLANAIVAMAFSGQSLSDVKIEIVEEPASPHAVRAAFDSFARYFREPAAAMDPAKYVGIVLADGLGGAEETLLETIGDLTNVTFIGGSAGDDLRFSGTRLYAHGNCYTSGAALILLKPTVPFTCIKTQSFNDLGRPLTVTMANEAKREVLEFDGRPAAVAYAEALGTTVENAANRFIANPLGLIIDGEPFVRSPQQIKADNRMSFYCGVREGMTLSLLQSTDIIADTRAAIDQARQELGGISAIINFNCILRTMELKQRGLSQEYGRLFADIPTIGFSTYGEQYIGHLNQTATMLVFR